MARTAMSTLCVSLLFGGSLAARAEEPSAASKAAVALSREGRYAEARSRLEQALGACAAGDSGRPCRALLHYTLGFVAQDQLEGSRRPSADEGVLGDAAIEAYEAALADAPDHGPTLANLASLFERRGNAALEADRPKDALASYERAMKLVPASEGVRRRLVAAWTAFPPKSLEPVLARLGEWESSWPGVAREGYVAVMRRTYATDAPIAEKALVRWLDLLAREDALTTADFAALPVQWVGPAPDALRAYMKTPWGEPATWWLQERSRVEALARVALALGKGFLAQGKGPEWPERCWQSALRVASPMSPRRVDLERELAMLYFHSPELDGNGQKMQRLLDQIFDEKMASIWQRDLDAVQRYHTTLGLIFAAQERWGTPSEPRGALFQLRHALDTAAQRSGPGMPPQPLPELRERLADGLTATGQKEQAFRTYVGAAQAYLDTDDLQSAERSLDRAQSLANAAKASASSLEPLRALGRLRSALAGPLPGPSDIAAALTWVQAPSAAGLAPDFVDRQRFKLLADAATRAPQGEQSLAAARALTVAADKKIPLQSPRDLLRVDDVTRIVNRGAGKIIGEATPASGDHVLQVGAELPGRAVRVSAQTMIQARLIEAGGLPPGAEVKVQGATITIKSESATAKELGEYQARVSRLPGVRAVVVKEKPEPPQD